MTNELENIILTIDTREQNQKRIKAVEDWAQVHGAVVEHSALKLCDYALLGEFRGVSVNIGIEAKALPDFATSYSELSDKLARAYQLYDDVALFVEAGNYTFTPDADNFHAIIANPSVRNGDADVLSLAVYENMLASLQKEGVHVRQLRSEVHFPYAIAGLLITIIKPIHTGLCIKSKDFTSQYLNVLAKVPYISMARATKLIKNYPNLSWLCSASKDSYQANLGRKIGSDLYAFIRCHDLETDEWRNNYHLNGTEKDEPKVLTVKDEPITSPDRITSEGHLIKINLCDYADPKNRAECKNSDHFKHYPCQYDDEKNCEMINKQCTITCPLNPNFKHHSSHPGKNISKDMVSPSLPGDTSQSLSTDNPDGNAKRTKQAHESTHGTFSHPGRYKKVKPKLTGDDTFSHPSTNSISPSKKLDDPHTPSPPENGAVKQEGFSHAFLPAETNTGLGLDDKPLESIVKCRACHQVILQDDDTGFCHDPKCIAERNKPKIKMNLKEAIKEFMADGKPHTLQEIVDKCEGWTRGNVFDHVMGAVESGYFKKVTLNDKVTFQRVT